jgi:hypothetical protein
MLLLQCKIFTKYRNRAMIMSHLTIQNIFTTLAILNIYYSIPCITEVDLVNLAQCIYDFVTILCLIPPMTPYFPISNIPTVKYSYLSIISTGFTDPLGMRSQAEFYKIYITGPTFKMGRYFKLLVKSY